MKLNRTSPYWDREERNNFNENWDIIENTYDGIISDAKDAIVEEFSDVLSKSETTIINEVYNGDFTRGQGLEGWDVYQGASAIAVDGKMIKTGDGGNRQVRVRQSNGFGLAEMPYNDGHRIYVKGNFKVTNSDSTGVGFDVYGSVNAGNIETLVKSNPEKDVKYSVSDVIELSGGSGNILMQIKTFYPNAETASGKSTEVENIVVIDLTRVFGKGNEPTKEEMDNFMSFFSNEFFDEDADVGKVTSFLLLQNAASNNEVETELNVVNGVINGNFDNNDRTPWLFLSGTTGIAENNTLHITGTGGNRLVRAYQISDIPYRLGDKIYVRGEFEVDNDDCQMAGFYLRSSGAIANETFFRKTAPRKDESFVMSGVMDIWDEMGSGKISTYLRADYAEAGIADGKTLKSRKVMAVNLTETFGKGNEPTDREYLDELFNRYPNGFFDNKPKTSDWQLSHTSFSLSVVKKTKQPLVVFGIDDGNLTDYTTAWPLFKQKGIKGSSYLVNKWVGSNDNRFMNKDMIQEMYQDGWDFQCHTANHEHFTDYETDQEIRDEFLINNQLFSDLELPQPEHHVYPFGNYNGRVIDIGLEYRKTLRATGMTSGIDYNEYDRPQLGALNARSIDIVEGEVGRINDIKNAIDLTVQNKGVLILYMHQIKEVIDGDYQAQVSVVEELIDYALQYIDKGNLTSVTHKEACEALYGFGFL